MYLTGSDPMKRFLTGILFVAAIAVSLVAGSTVDTTGESQRRERALMQEHRDNIAHGYALFERPVTSGTFVRIRGFWPNSDREEVWLATEVAGNWVYMQNPAYQCGVYCVISITPWNDHMAKIRQVVYADDTEYALIAAEYARQNRVN